MKYYQNISAFMVYLDALFDTRLTLLYEMNPDSVKLALESDYLFRDEEVFPGIDKHEFITRYHERDKRLLKNAMVTPVIDMIVQFIHETNHNNISSPQLIRPKIIINTYPYHLSKEEGDIIKAAVNNYIKHSAEVEILHIPYESLTPTYLRQEVSIVMMYDYYRWLETHSESKLFESDRCPDISLIAPGLYFKSKPNRQMSEKAKELGLTPLGVIEAHAGPIIDLKLVTIDVYCAKYIKRPKKKVSINPD